MDLRRQPVVVLPANEHGLRDQPAGLRCQGSPSTERGANASKQGGSECSHTAERRGSN